MLKKIIVLIFLVLLIGLFCFKLIFEKKEKINKNIILDKNIESYNSNLLENVKYFSKDAKGNKYSIKASSGEIDLKNENIIFLKKVISTIKLNNSEEIIITSDYGKYNSDNYDTIFSKNVIILYLDNKITGEYLDFSLDRNTMIISRNVIYSNLENILKADVIEVDIETKDTKIYMYENETKVNIKNKD